MSTQITGNYCRKYAFTDLNQTIIEQIVDIQLEPETADCLWVQLKEVTLSETVADNWTFVRGKITELETKRPSMRLAFSREYAGRLEAKTILGILKSIIKAYGL